CCRHRNHLPALYSSLIIIGVTLIIKRIQLLGLTLGVIVALPACGGLGSPSPPRHVFVIVMENKSPEEALSGSFTASLAAKYREAANYHAVAHPSVPNYLAMTSGSTWGVTDDSYHALPAQDIGAQLPA